MLSGDLLFLKIAKNSSIHGARTNSIRRFLVSSSFVREYESREIVRVLAGTIAEPGNVVIQKRLGGMPFAS